VWRESCPDCADDTADKHRRETGHPVGVQKTSVASWQELQQMTGLAHPVLARFKKRGW
jgi:hypothetical protein